jgi:hypothetical protein
MKRLLRLDWDALAGIVAALAALILHLLHIVDEGVLLALALVLLALLLIRDLKRESESEKVLELAKTAEASLSRIESIIEPPQVVLFGPSQLVSESERFSSRARGDMIWFNVCLTMFRPQALFDTMLRPAIDNPLVSSILFICDEKEKALWESDVMPKVRQCRTPEKVKEPKWCALDEPLSFILSHGDGVTMEALLSFWGEPFMARTTERDVPRYIFYVPSSSDLLPRLAELERNYRMRG